MHIIDASRLRSASSTATLHLYPFPQFCCSTNINILWYGLYFQGSFSPKEALGLNFRPSLLFHLFLTRLVQDFFFWYINSWCCDICCWLRSFCCFIFPCFYLRFLTDCTLTGISWVATLAIFASSYNINA